MSKERPILFSAPMILAILAGQKTQTRRIFKAKNGGLWPNKNDLPGMNQILRECPYGEPGDHLWVRETHYAWGRWETRFSEKKRRDEWHFVDMTPDTARDYLYAADNEDYTTALSANKGRGVFPSWWKRPAIFMPRWASRILLEIVSVRVERLNDCSDSDAEAEGITAAESLECDGWVNAYSRLWEQINGPDSWDANPWVWVVEFKRIES